MLPEYLEHYLRSPIGFQLAMSFTKAVAQPSLSMGTIRKIPVAIPPIAEQMRIVKETVRIISIDDNLKSIIDTNLKRTTRLRQAILKWAFEGKLADQDPNDEPAAELLERIRQ